MMAQRPLDAWLDGGGGTAGPPRPGAVRGRRGRSGSGPCSAAERDPGGTDGHGAAAGAAKTRDLAERAAVAGPASGRRRTHPERAPRPRRPSSTTNCTCQGFLGRRGGTELVEGWMWHALAHLQACRRSARLAVAAARSGWVLVGSARSTRPAILSEPIADVVLAGDAADAAVEGCGGGWTSPSAPVGQPHAGACSWSNAAMAAASRSLPRARRNRWSPAVAGSWDRRGRAGGPRRPGRYDHAERLSLAVDAFEGTDFEIFHAGQARPAEVLGGDPVAGTRRSTQWKPARALHQQKGSPVEVAQAEPERWRSSWPGSAARGDRGELG